MARDYFDRAIARDPNYAEAYSGLADTYALLGDWQYAVMAPAKALPMAKAAAIKALELDNRLGDAHTSLDSAWTGSIGISNRPNENSGEALSSTPSYATAHHWYAWHLTLVGRDREAIAEMRKAQNLDPLSLIINADLAELLLIAHRSDESVQQSRKTIEMDSTFALAHNQLGQAYLQQGKRDEAIAELQTGQSVFRGSPTHDRESCSSLRALGQKK